MAGDCRARRDNPVVSEPLADAALDPELQRFMQLLRQQHADGGWIQLVLSGPQRSGGAEPDLQRVTVRPLRLRGGPVLSVVSRHATKDLTQNHAPDEGLALIAGWLGTRFRHAHFSGREADAELRFGKRGTGHLSLSPHAVLDAVAAETPHDRPKQRLLQAGRPYLAALGLTTPEGQPVPAMARKWKQINRFVEIVAAAIARSPLATQREIRVVDFGAGRAYLTFALHDWLQHQGLRVEVRGVEQRADLVDEGNRIVQRLGLQGLQMVQGDVGDAAAAPERFDVMIALHACDTATDAAIHRGIRAGAPLIICSPCCHKQLRPQLLSPGPLRSVFAHGIHAEQQAEMLTDTLRALLLQADGYETQVFEFVALEHTRKNKMILAVKKPGASTATEAAKDAAERAAALAQADELQRFFGIREQALRQLLAM
jgi:Methyltransferase domain